MLRGRPPRLGLLARKPVTVYITLQTHGLLRDLAEAGDVTIGALVEKLVAAEAERRGVAA